METNLIIFITSIALGTLYTSYQFARNNKVFEIRLKWIDTRQSNRLKRWSYDYIYKPKKSNWYGLKYPNEKDYK